MEANSLAEELIQRLIEKKMSLATAESCTGGLVAKFLTDVAGASEVFKGGVVPYSNEMKMAWLGVRAETLERYGAVSGETVTEMVHGLLENSGADVGVAISGIAGPSGGTAEKPVGTVFIACQSGDVLDIERHHFEGNREAIRNNSAAAALSKLIHIICENRR